MTVSQALMIHQILPRILLYLKKPNGEHSKSPRKGALQNSTAGPRRGVNSFSAEPRAVLRDDRGIGAKSKRRAVGGRRGFNYQQDADGRSARKLLILGAAGRALWGYDRRRTNELYRVRIGGIGENVHILRPWLIRGVNTTLKTIPCTKKGLVGTPSTRRNI